MQRKRALILFGGHGGAARGFELAGYDAYCVDLAPSPRNPYPVHTGDAIAVMEALLRGAGVVFRRADGYDVTRILEDFDMICAHPPCQAFSQAQRIRGNDHPDLISATRALLRETGLPYIIENVVGAPLEDPVMICGPMVGVDMYRHRLFETSFPVQVPPHAPHTHPQVKMGRSPRNGEWIQAVGNFAGVAEARRVMGCPWMNRDGLRLTVPPAYITFIVNQYQEA